VANVYVDFTLATGLNNGSSWANAYQAAAGLVSAASAAAAGDDVWCKNHVSDSSTTARTVDFTNGTLGNPVRVWGCKAATTNEPPQASDLIPGLATGNSTPAYDDAGIPGVTQTSASANISIHGFFRAYAMKLLAGQNMNVGESNTRATGGRIFEECYLKGNNGANSSARPFDFGYGSSSPKDSILELVNCHLQVHDSDDFFRSQGAALRLIGGKLTSSGTKIASGFIVPTESSKQVILRGVDLSDFGAVPIVNRATLCSVVTLERCRVAASWSLSSGTWGFQGLVRSHLTRENPSFSSTDSIRQWKEDSPQGSCASETTVVRSGGADDGGSGAHAITMIPAVGATVDNHWALKSPPLTGWVAAGSQTLTIYVANSGAGDYQNDEVWVEVSYPSESTSAILPKMKTTQMALLGTPANLTDDTSSDWGTGAGGRNAQKLEVAIAPAYEGPIEVIVCFAKRFAASPETLYIDPQVYISGHTSSKQYLLPGCGIASEFTSGGAGGTLANRGILTGGRM